MASFGEELRRERELRRISLREVSEATKINIRYLEALERNDFRHLPGGVFNKGFVKAYAQFIGVDPEAMINAYLLESQGQSKDAAGGAPGVLRPRRDGAVSQDEDRSAEAARERSRRGVRVAAALGAAAVVIAIIATLLLLPDDDTSSSSTATNASRPTEARETAVEPPIAPDRGEIATEPPRNSSGAASSEPSTGSIDPDAPPSARGADASSPPDAEEPGGRVIVELRRPTSGRLDCDRKQIEMLDGATAGTRFELRCETGLVIDAEDGGAVWVGTSASGLSPIGTPGERVRGWRWSPRRDAADEADGGGS